MTTLLAEPPPKIADLALLDPFFGPDAPQLPDADPMPDAMQQNPYILHLMQILDDLHGGPDTLVDTNTMVYYDPSDRNRRVQPDICIAFSVDAAAIYRRNGYVIWEVGKPPDFALEVASESTAANDTGRKRELYAALGIAEYWRFDASGGAMYGAALAGEYLVNGVYRPFPIRTAADGALWGYSPLLNLNLRWHDGGLELQDPHTSEILLDRRGVRLSLESALDQRDAALASIAEYREQVRQLQAQLRQQERPPE